MDVPAQHGGGVAGCVEQLARSTQALPRPVRDAAGPEWRVVDEDDLASEVLVQIPLEDPTLGDDGPADLAAGVDGGEAVG